MIVYYWCALHKIPEKGLNKFLQAGINFLEANKFKELNPLQTIPDNQEDFCEILWRSQHCRVYKILWYSQPN